MLKPYNVSAVLRNIESVFKNQNIYKLNKAGYNFLYLMSGFIAHYNLNGFKCVYKNLDLLLQDIKEALPIEKDCAIRDINDPKHNGYGLPYCQNELDIIVGLELIVKKYEKEIINSEAEKDNDRFALLKELVKRGETDLEIRQKVIEMAYN